MSKAPIMPFYTDAYLADCHHLSTEAHGAYMLILLHTWRLGGKALPDNDKALMRIVKAKSITRWRQLRSELLPFFDITDGHWHQSKLERTWSEVVQKIEQNRDNAKQRYSPNMLKNKVTGPATAPVSQVPSINHEPNPKPISANEEDVMMTLLNKANPALDALAPVLKDSRYFTHRSEHRVSPSLRPQVEAAIAEMEAQLTPASAERIHQIVHRLILHFSCVAGERKESVCEDYTAMLASYPEDLLWSAYQHVLKHHKYNSLPKIADLLAFIEPEMAYRRTQRRKLDILHKQTLTEELA